MNRPEARNALDVPMRQELADLIAEIRDDDRVKAVILTGAGGVFCAGGDLRGLKEKRTSAQSYKRIADLHVWLPSLVNLEKPVIAAVDGPAFGGGMNLALAADFVLASDNARFCQVFGRIGLVPDLAGMSLLPRLVGLQRAKELVFSGRTLRPDEAKEMGIVHSVHAPDQLQDAAFALARRFCNASTLAIGLAKNILNQSFNLDQRAMAELEAMAQALCMDSTYHKEAVQRFLDKEPALFDWDSMDKKEAAT
ncbi:probable enoyl-CoA hydratase [Pseudooceanicola batsensis HTCC2597]|uniref:Probable enoyl-CoA hydratase n=1 Tax=Pseudooceanicola batsensis (strain ATCC BAA-863 / DSM 15984 / KCTC 12145 / HTCC2597) TaxID=252305 RepID=A3TZG0_PSEBH|nr:probable enoyl-CoA hydratase [Pseudooceanicola batsensis HTCC2597]